MQALPKRVHRYNSNFPPFANYNYQTSKIEIYQVPLTPQNSNLQTGRLRRQDGRISQIVGCQQTSIIYLFAYIRRIYMLKVIYNNIYIIYILYALHITVTILAHFLLIWNKNLSSLLHLRFCWSNESKSI